MRSDLLIPVMVQYPAKPKIESVFVDQVHHHVREHAAMLIGTRRLVYGANIFVASREQRLYPPQDILRRVQVLRENRGCSRLLQRLKELLQKVAAEAVMREKWTDK